MPSKRIFFSKLSCNCQPLSRLFQEGQFNTLDLQAVELSTTTRTYLEGHPAATALLEYACLKNDAGEQVSKKLEEQIRKAPEDIDSQQFFCDAFYGVSYTDYLFSLPMGAGKTYLMAAFIYLDLYFAMNEPHNPAFAHNFIIFAPSGLKSSVVPSLKTIQKFNPAWVIPEPAASNIKRMLSFEVLDQGKTANKSNKTKNPNVQKIANHQPLSELFGLVAVTNAEKVVLDRIQEKNGQISMYDESDDEKDRQANELRNLIGKLPALAIFIDEVHHAVSDEIKLRAVVNRWTEGGTVSSVIGFSGTPYLEKAEKFIVTDTLTVGTAVITNTIYYYPLVDGVGNFLKRPVVKISDVSDSGRIIENGVREFLNFYKDTVYQNGTAAKLGIYCGKIEKLEELVYPLVSRIAGEYGGMRYFSSRYDRPLVEANIRKAFCEKRTYKTRSECIPEAASLLNIANFSSVIHAQNTADYFPTQDMVERIIQDDKGKLKPDKNTLQMMQLAEQAGQTQVLEILRRQIVSHPQKDRSFHYLPYRTDSDLEQIFLRDVLPLPEIAQFGLEVYYNGDRAMTEFKIKCYKSTGHGWNYIGMYTPDFLIIQRRDGKIHKALIVETKGKIYANDPTFKDKRTFVESEFLRQNNAAFGYERFEYLYLEDTMPDRERVVRTHQKICEFFGAQNG